LVAAFKERASAVWSRVLDDHAVPAELTSEDSVVDLFDDPELKAKNWITSFEHPTVGAVETVGVLFDFSDTPAPGNGAAPLVGQHSREILAQVGLAPSEIDDLVQRGVVVDGAV
jgi:crotonobetainyl-CoA:carnitine CoA-transferase CaiB-like acyl-CoA transferase